MKFEMTHAGIVKAVAGLIGVSMAIYHMWAIWFGTPEAIVFRGAHLMFAMALTFLYFRYKDTTGRDAPSPLDYLLLIAAVAPIAYLMVNYDYIVNRIYYVDDLTIVDMSMAILLVAMILEATRRVMGWALPLTAVVFLVYAVTIANVEHMRMLDQLFMTTEGIFGIPLGVSASYVMIFVVFGAFMERTGTGQLFMDFAMSLTGHTSGGPGKVAVVSSSLFGTISGSAVANVMVTGSISIPMMKRTGFRPPFAAAVEAVASTGGQLMPPIMGAAAFVMAEFLAVSYLQVTLWALIPALLYYLACFAAVHFEARYLGLKGIPREELPQMTKVIGERGHLFLPPVIILVTLYMGYSAPLAALIGTLSCFPVAAMRATTRHYVTLDNLLGALVDGAKGALGVALACACAGIIIGIVTLTGLGISFTQVVTGLAAQNLLLALMLTMVAGIILGMGMPTTPAYIIMTALLVPALIKMGVIEPAAHMFAFYFAILSAITPPVALAVYAAANIAKSDVWTSGWVAVKLGLPGFIVPFMFVYEPALLLIGDWSTIAVAVPTACAGAILLSAGLQGFLLDRLALWQRALLVASALLLIKPGLVTDLAGAAMVGLVVLTQLMSRRRVEGAATRPGE